MPSKLTNILAAGGNSVITADDDTTLGELARDWPGIAFLVEPASDSALIDGIERTLAMAPPNCVAFEYAESHLEKHTVMRNFMSHFSPDLEESGQTGAVIGVRRH